LAPGRHVLCADFPRCSEINAGFFYSDSETRDKLVAAERKHTDERVKKIIELKKQVRSGTSSGPP